MAASSTSAFARNAGSRVLAASVAAAFPSIPINDASASNSAFCETMAHSTEQSTMMNNGMANVQMNEGHFTGGDVEDVARTVFAGADGSAANGNFRRLLSAASTLPPEVKSLGTQLAKDPDIQRALIKHFHAKLVAPAANTANATAASPLKDDSKTATATDDYDVREIPLSDAEDEEEFHSPTPIASSAESSAVLVEPEVLARDQQLLEQFRISAMTTPTPPVRLSRMTTPQMEQPGEEKEGVPRVASSVNSGKNEAKENHSSASEPVVAVENDSKSSGVFVDFVNNVANGAARVASNVARKFEQILSGLESYVASFYHDTKPDEQPGALQQASSCSSSSSAAATQAASSSTSSSAGLRDVLASGLYFAAAVIGVLVLWKLAGPVIAAAAAPTL